MTTSATRWIVTVGWMTAMTFVWAILVPSHLSTVLFALIAVAGLFVTLCGVALLSDSQPPRSVSAILADLEAGGRGGAHAHVSMTGANTRQP